MLSSIITNRNSTITAPAYTSICTAAKKNAFSKTNSPDIQMMVSTRNIALVTGLRLKGLNTTNAPQSRVSVLKI